MTTCASSAVRKFVTTQHSSSHGTGFSLVQDQKIPGSTTRGRPSSNRATTGTESIAVSANIQRIRTPNRSWHHNFWTWNSPTEQGKIKHPVPGDRQHDLQPDRGKPPQYPHRRHEAHRLPAWKTIEAQESNISQVRFTPRVLESCTVPEATDPLAEGTKLLEQREK